MQEVPEKAEPHSENLSRNKQTKGDQPGIDYRYIRHFKTITNSGSKRKNKIQVQTLPHETLKILNTQNITGLNKGLLYRSIGSMFQTEVTAAILTHTAFILNE